MKISAGIWIASLPKEMEGRSVLGVEFISPETVNMKKWRPTVSLAWYTPDDLMFRKGITESIIEGFHLSRTQIDVQDTSLDDLMRAGREVAYPRIRRAVLIVDIACRTGHIYISPEVIFKIKDSVFHTWVGESVGRPQGESKEDLLALMERVLSSCQDGFFTRKIERALIRWGEAQEEPQEELKVAKLWTALDALLRRRREDVWRSVCRRSITLVMMETTETIDLFSIASWRISFDRTNLGGELRNFLREAYDARNAVYHESEEPSLRLGFSLDLSSFTQVLILKMAEFAEKGYNWVAATEEIDQTADELGVNMC